MAEPFAGAREAPDGPDQKRRRLRSARWLESDDLSGFIHRNALGGNGSWVGAREGRPLVGVCNAWSELVRCNVHFRALGDAVKRGVVAAGGLPLEFPTIVLGEALMKPTAMLYRNLMAMDVEESIRANPLDAVVLIGGCDKTIPAQLMGATSAEVPAIMLTGGPSQATVFRGARLGSGTDVWRYADDVRAGRMSREAWEQLEAATATAPGHCVEMGTAATMAAVVEALGMSLPGSAALPALDARRIAVAEATGRCAVALAVDDVRPSAILDRAAFDNAIAVLVAIGGSTNAVIHLVAIAGRAGVELPLERFAEIARRTPLLANVRPSGEHLFEDLIRAGGIPSILAELMPLLDGDARTVTGATIAEAAASATRRDGGLIGSLAEPISPPGGLAVVGGTLAPRGALLKRSAASERLLCHRGEAVVFDGIEHLAGAINEPNLPVDADSVLVLRNAGPRGGPGMPEWGMLPIPEKLLRAGVDDMVRISDGRMSGTGFGTVVLHVAPEAAVGGPLALVRNGDPIVLDADAGRLDLDVPVAELEARRREWAPPQPHYRRGFGRLFLEHVLQADEGCDFDFLRSVPGESPGSEPLGLLEGWIGGW